MKNAPSPASTVQRCPVAQAAPIAAPNALAHAGHPHRKEPAPVRGARGGARSRAGVPRVDEHHTARGQGALDGGERSRARCSSWLPRQRGGEVGGRWTARARARADGRQSAGGPRADRRRRACRRRTQRTALAAERDERLARRGWLRDLAAPGAAAACRRASRRRHPRFARATSGCPIAPLTPTKRGEVVERIARVGRDGDPASSARRRARARAARRPARPRRRR